MKSAKIFIAVCLTVGTALACSKFDNSKTSSEAIITGTAEVTELGVTVCGYLNIDASVLNTCQFGILYSADKNPSEKTGFFIYSSELDSKNRFEVSLDGLIPETEYSYRAFIKYNSGSFQYGEVRSFRTADAVMAGIDLGLSVKWASCNLGASKPEEYGGYYQWAGLEDVSDLGIFLDWNNCPYHTGSYQETGWTKYVPSDKSSYWSGSGNPDNKTVLDPSDDVAHVKLGGKWRMPTDAEWEELINNCTWTWTTQNGVEGYKVTSEKPGYTSKSIFLPAAGYRYDVSLYNAGSYGRYWSSSLYTDRPDYAHLVYFSSVDVYMNSNSRCNGRSVRPVSE